MRMKKLSIFVCVCLLVVCATLLCGCNSSDELKIETQNSLSLAVGTRQKVSYSVNPAIAIVQVASDNTSVVKTEGNMLVAVSVGEATITFLAQYKGKSATATCIVTVYGNEENPNTPDDKDNDSQIKEKVEFYLDNTNGTFDRESKTLTVKQGELSYFKLYFDENIENFNEISKNYTLSCKDFDISLLNTSYAWTFITNSNCTINILFNNEIIATINVVVE